MNQVLAKRVTKTDVQHRLTIPTETLEVFNIPNGIRFVDVQAIDNKDSNIWEFRIQKRRGRHPKPVLCAGWLHYVNHKGLQVNDIVTIRFNNVGRTQFSIQSQRFLVRLFGMDHYSDL